MTGGSYGGIYVDKNFVSLLENLFGGSVVEEFRFTHPAEWLRLMNEFEMKKRGKRAFEGKSTRIIIPRNFMRMVSYPSNSDLAGRFAKECNLRDVEIYNDEYLSLRPNAMIQLFQPVVSGIIKHMTELFRCPALDNVSCLFMVGGFAESVILQEAIKTAFSSKCKVLIPNYASIAVVQGATMFGQRPTIVSSRIMATTYGFGGYKPFDPEVHPPEKRCVIEGKVTCKDKFFVFVQENDAVKVGETKRFIRKPLYSDQRKVMFDFYTSTDPNPQFVTDPTVGPCIGQVIVDSPDTSKGRDRKIEVHIFFGGTEIKVTAVDQTSGSTATAYLDFLCKP